MIAQSATSEVSTSALREIAAIADRYSATVIAEFARASADRVAEGRFFLACVGQAKRGKSTLINALIGGTVLPTGVPPVTSVPTVLRYGPDYAARVRIAGAPEWIPIDPAALTDFVSETQNPGNAKHVAGVEVFAPLPLLASGMNLVDTPGIGSVYAANTSATRDFLPHIDAALIVLGADPPISGEERALVAELAPRVSRMLFVLNKSDRIDATDQAAALEFTRRILIETLRHSRFDIFCVSALEQLQKDPSAPPRDWPALESTLGEVLAGSGRTIVHDANRRAAASAAARLMAVLDAERRTLTEPLAASEERIALLTGALQDAEIHLADLSALLTVQEQRITAEFARRRKEFVPTAVRVCRNEFSSRAAAHISSRNGPALRRALNRIAQGIVSAELQPFLACEAARAESAFTSANARFAELGSEFLRRINGGGSSGLGLLSADELAPLSLTAHSEYRFNSIERVASPASPFRFAGDLMLGLCGAQSVIVRSSEEFLDQLIETNSARIQNDLARRVAESRRTLESALRARLREAAITGARSLERARFTHAEGSAAVAAALAELDRCMDKIRPLVPDPAPSKHEAESPSKS